MKMHLRLVTRFAVAVAIALAVGKPAFARIPIWEHSGSLFVLTTPEGADLPKAAEIEGFPLLVRLYADSFDFSRAKADGADVRFSSADGRALAYQIEEWDPVAGVASIWVRIPKIQGQARQEIRMKWGNPDAVSESDGNAVFDKTNGYLGVWHMNGAADDGLGTTQSKDTGTTSTAGIVGRARHFAGKQGIFAGDNIVGYPVGSTSHTTEAWFRAETPNSTIVGWGREGGGRGSKVRMQFRSPPHVHIDSDFSDVDGKGRLRLGEWVHVVHTYDRDDGRIYIDGRLDGSAKPTLAIKAPARLWIGGWYNNYDFVGDIDEVRISQVARSPDWIRLQYENQKPLQTAVGPLVQAGDAFSVSTAKLAVAEGATATVTAKAGGALKVYWSLVRDGIETVVATDRFSYALAAGRIVGDRSITLRFKAIYPTGAKVLDIPVTLREEIPEPLFSLEAPDKWDGRTPIEVAAKVANAAEMEAKGAGKLRYTWTVGDIATSREELPGKLVLKRAQNSGRMIVTLAIDNGGRATTHSTTIDVKEPAKDPWVERVAAAIETPEPGQFYARDDKNEGTLVYNGKLVVVADSVFLKVYADDKLVDTIASKLAADGSYSLSAKLKPGLIHYRIEFGSRTGDRETVLNQVGNLVCGDAYLIVGQSNAVATDFGKEDPTFRSEWIRTFGSASTDPKRVALWGNAVHRSRDADKLQVGYWGMELGRKLVQDRRIPIFLINGAVGGTRIDQHQRSIADPEDGTTIYGRLLWRVRQAKLTHGIRGILWHQGENDQGADGPTGGFGWETYRNYFIELASAWKRDYPNVRHYYTFQIWPKSCSMGIDGSDNRLREVQRNLRTAFSNLSVMSTLGIDPPGGCHFPAAGYAEFAKLIGPLVERDNYGAVPVGSIDAANLQRAHFASDRKDEIVLEFDSPVKWNDRLTSQFYLDGEKGKVASGSASGTTIRLVLTSPSKAAKLTYLDSASWSQANLLRGENGIAALTFFDVPILPAK